MKTKIFLVEDEQMAIKYFKTLLAECGEEYEVVGEANNGARALPEIRRTKPDIVFADINMPIMDGLEMSAELLKTNNPPIVFILSAYRDFDYVKTGMKLGVRDYILKNDLTSEYLKKLLDDTMVESDLEQRDRHKILEYNIRNFLNSSTSNSNDLIYKTKSLQRYALIHIVRPANISLTGMHRGGQINVDCYEMNNVPIPEGLTCNAFVEMDKGEYAAIIFIQPECRNAENSLNKLAKNMLEKFDEYADGGIAIISNLISKFEGLQELYQTSKGYLGLAYLFEGKRIVTSDEITNVQRTEINPAEKIMSLLDALANGNGGKARDIYTDYANAVREGDYFQDYISQMRDLYRALVNFVAVNKLNPDLTDVRNQYTSIQEMESDLKKMVETIAQAMEDRAKKKYSSYVMLAMEFIQKNYMRDISIPEIAEAANISEGHLRRCFKQETNTKVVSYLMDCRIEHAKKMMQTSGYSLDEIWRRTGFTSAQYFSYAFKQKEGVAPREYMKSIVRG